MIGVRYNTIYKQCLIFSERKKAMPEPLLECIKKIKTIVMSLKNIGLTKIFF